MSKAPVSIGGLRLKGKAPKASDFGHIEINDEKIVFLDLENTKTIIEKSDVKYIKPFFSSLIVVLKSGKKYKFDYLQYDPTPLSYLSDATMYAAGFRTLILISKTKLNEHTLQLVKDGFPLIKSKFMGADLEFVTNGRIAGLLGIGGAIGVVIMLIGIPIALYGNLAGLNSESSPRSIPELIVEVGLLATLIGLYYLYFTSAYKAEYKSLRLYLPFILFCCALVNIYAVSI